MTDQHTAFYLNLILVILDTVEKELPEKSARRNRVSGVNKEVSRVADFFKPFAWEHDDCMKAALIIERIDVLVKEFYPTIDDDQIEFCI